MKISLPKSGWRFIIVLVAFHFIAVQFAHSSEAKLGEASELLKQAADLKKAGYYAKAIPIMENVLDLQREGAEGVNADVARSLDELGELHYLAGKYAEAEPFLAEALSMRKEIFRAVQLEKSN